MESAIRVELWGDEIDGIYELNALTGEVGQPIQQFDLYPANQFITQRHKLEKAIHEIRDELDGRVTHFENNNLLVEAQRIRMRTDYDLEMLQEMGFCSGIENYSRHLSGRKTGDRPFCLLDFFPDDFLLFIDESHVSLPQIGRCIKATVSKRTLGRTWFSSPSALTTNLQPEEFESVTGQTVYVSATPAQTELQKSPMIAEQIIRPTGLLDPTMEVRP